MKARLRKIIRALLGVVCLALIACVTWVALILEHEQRELEKEDHRRLVRSVETIHRDIGEIRHDIIEMTIIKRHQEMAP